MSPLWVLGLGWLICGFTCVCESPVGTDAASKRLDCNYRKSCKGMQYDIRAAVCCENRLHPGAGLSCCGDLAFNPTAATCCKGKVILGLGEKVSACCGLHAYSPLNEMCCQSTVLAKPVPKAQCCGNETFDEDKQLCCGVTHKKKILARTSNHHQCCGYNQFNTITHCCCLMNGVLEIQHMNSGCCVEDTAQIPQSVMENMSMNPNNPVMESSSQSTIDAKPGPKMQNCGNDSFDVDNQLCCGSTDNKTILARNSSHHQCCGHDQYDNETECCCLIDENLEIRHINSSCCAEEAGVEPQNLATQPQCNEPATSLCGSLCYNPKELHCCERNQKKPHWCCLPGQCDVTPTVYNPCIQVCCDGCVSERKPWIDQCCGQTPYGLAQVGVLCCNNALYEDREDGEKCSQIGIPYNPAKGTICCSQFHGSPGQHCCGTEIYQPQTEICCNGHRQPKVEHSHCCGIQAYNIKDPQMKCCAGTLYNLTSSGKHGQCCGSILKKSQEVCCSSEDKELLYAKKTGFRCCGHLYYNTSLWSCCAGELSPVHQPGQRRAGRITESIFPSVNNLNKTYLCGEMKIGILESVSLHSIVFSNVLKIHGTNATVKALPSPYILKRPASCNSPKLIPGKTYIFDEVNVFTDFNHDSSLQSLHFIISKCRHA